jgi:hypothetical protein
VRAHHDGLPLGQAGRVGGAAGLVEHGVLHVDQLWPALPRLELARILHSRQPPLSAPVPRASSMQPKSARLTHIRGHNDARKGESGMAATVMDVCNQEQEAHAIAAKRAPGTCRNGRNCNARGVLCVYVFGKHGFGGGVWQASPLMQGGPRAQRARCFRDPLRLARTGASGGCGTSARQRSNRHQAPPRSEHLTLLLLKCLQPLVAERECVTVHLR